MAAYETAGRYRVGLALLFAVVLIWVGSSYLMHSIFGEQAFNKPFFITYVNTASLSLHLVIYFQSSKECRFERQRRQQQQRQQQQREPEAESDINLAPLTFVETAKVSAAFCLTWFAANSASNSSLAYTTVANSTILSSTSGIFTLMLGAYVGTESFVVSKLAAVASSFIGVYLVCNATPQQATAISAMNEITPTMIGNGLALLGAVLYAAYTTLLKVRVGDERRINTPLFLGMVGVFNTVFLWLWLALMHYTGIEPFEWPPSAHIWGMIIVNALIGTFLSDLCWMLAMLMTSPLVTTLGLSLTIPLALFGDVVFKHAILPPSYWVGSFLVVIGFIAINLSEQQIEDAITEIADVSIL
ncbi:hypothetical protein GQ42DRAFT_174523 [Ramicandelaber brevisporus]|nr:hypothetical protein GQ42DRAFT_174523 [Ramicandelaber brevisporus]